MHGNVINAFFVYQGEYYWKTTPFTEAPFTAPCMPANGATDRMLYFYISDYMFNTLFYAAQSNRYLQLNITASDVSNAFKPAYCTRVVAVRSDNRRNSYK